MSADAVWRLPLRLIEGWANLNQRGDWNAEHHHSSHVSGAYYVSAGAGRSVTARETALLARISGTGFQTATRLGRRPVRPANRTGTAGGGPGAAGGAESAASASTGDPLASLVMRDPREDRIQRDAHLHSSTPDGVYHGSTQFASQCDAGSPWCAALAPDGPRGILMGRGLTGVPGSIVLFPAFLRHAVPEHLGNGMRISVAFNVHVSSAALSSAESGAFDPLAPCRHALA